MASSFEVENPSSSARQPTFARQSAGKALHRATIAAIPFDDANSSATLLASVVGDAEGATSGKLTAMEAAANFVIACVGAGIVVFPRVMADNGWLLCSAELVFSTAVCYECGCLILECCAMTEQLTGKAAGSLVSFEEIAQAALGPTGQAGLAVTKNSYMLGGVLMFMVLLTDTMSTFFAKFLSAFTVRWAVSLPLFLSLAMITNLKQVATFAPLGSGAVFLQCLAIAFGASIAFFFGEEASHTPVAGGITDIGMSISCFVFGYDAIVALPSIRGQMEKADDAQLFFRGSFGVVFLICAVVMVIGYIGFGEAVDENVILTLDSKCAGFVGCNVGSVASVAIMVNLCISAPLVWYVFISYVESATSGALARPLSPANAAFRVAVTLALFITGSLLASVKGIMSLTSAVFGSFNSIFFPLMCFYRLRQLSGSGFTGISRGRMAFHCVIFFAGCTAMLFGVLGAIEQKVEEEAAEPGA